MNLTAKAFSALRWLLGLFDSPPLDSMTARQKVGRVFLVTISLVVLCIFCAMVFAGGIFLAECSHGMILALRKSDFRDVARMAEILLLSVTVNALCIWVLFQVRRLDRNLMADL